MSFRCFNGEIPKGHLIRYTCDNGKCWNPKHLLSGDQFDNMADAVSRDRQAKGMKLSTKLTDADVIAIRTSCAHGANKRALGREYGVSESTIGQIARRVIWKHIGG